MAVYSLSFSFKDLLSAKLIDMRAISWKTEELMKIQDVIDEIKLELTGNLLETEIEDETIAQLIKKALREMGRYWDETTLITVPFASCIDLTDFNVVSIVKVYRTEGTGVSDSDVSVMNDPAYMQQ